MATEGSSARISWGILGCGKISNDFANAIHQAKGCDLVTVGARNVDSAEAFGKLHGAKRWGNYDAVVSDAEVQIIYVGSIHPYHYKLVLSALEAGKHVLVEKPMGMNARECKEMAAKAKEKGLFLMEGVWTRCFPATRKVVEILSSGALGDVVQFVGDLGFDIPFEVDRLYDLNLGGGGLLDLGIYPLSWLLLAFAGKDLKGLSASARLHKGGADMSGVITAKFGDEGIGACMYSTRSLTQNEVEICCREGRIRVGGPESGFASAHTPERIEIWTAGDQLLKGQKKEVLTFPVPKFKTTKSPMNFPNSEGFLYEVEHVAECLRQNLKESPNWTLAETIQCAEIMDEVRKQVGVKYPTD